MVGARLEQALNDAGLRTDANALQFSLRGESGSQNGGNAQNGGDRTGAQTANGEATDEPIYDYDRAASLRGGVDTYV